MTTWKNSRTFQVVTHTAVITVLAVLLSNTLVKNFTSMTSIKPSTEGKDESFFDIYTVVANKSLQTKISDNVVIVAIDGLTREQITEVLDSISAASPKAIGIDCLFRNQRENDSALIAATSAPNIIMATGIVDDTIIDKSWFCDSNHLSKPGIVNIEKTSPTDVVRYYRSQFKIGDLQYMSLPAAVAAAAGHDDIQHDTETSYIFFPSLDFWTIEPWMIVEQPEECHNIIKDKIILVGDIENMQEDMHQTPIGIMSGLEIQASIVETIVGQHNVKCSPSWINWVIAILSCSLIMMFNMFLSDKNLATGKLLFRLVQILLMYIYFWTGCMLFAKHSLYVDFSPALSMIAIEFLSSDIYFGILALYKKFKIKLENRKK